jgi:hypothetical protein
MRQWIILGISLMVFITLVTAQQGQGGGNGGGGGGGHGGGGQGQGGHGQQRRGNQNGWGRGRGRGNNGNCHCPTIPAICGDNETTSYDNDGCVNCISFSAEIDGCTLDELSDCATSWTSLPECDDGAFPERDNDT